MWETSRPLWLARDEAIRGIQLLSLTMAMDGYGRVYGCQWSFCLSIFVFQDPWLSESHVCGPPALHSQRGPLLKSPHSSRRAVVMSLKRGARSPGNMTPHPLGNNLQWGHVCSLDHGKDFRQNHMRMFATAQWTTNAISICHRCDTRSHGRAGVRSAPANVTAAFSTSKACINFNLCILLFVSIWFYLCFLINLFPLTSWFCVLSLLRETLERTWKNSGRFLCWQMFGFLMVSEWPCRCLGVVVILAALVCDIDWSGSCQTLPHEDETWWNMVKHGESSREIRNFCGIVWYSQNCSITRFWIYHSRNIDMSGSNSSLQRTGMWIRDPRLGWSCLCFGA